MYRITESQALEILGLKAGSDKAEIKRAYHILAKKYHPDNELTGKKEAYELIRSAYELLLNKEEAPVIPRRIIGKPESFSVIKAKKQEYARFQKNYEEQLKEESEEMKRRSKEARRIKEEKQKEAEYAKRAAEILRRLILTSDK